MKISRSVLSLTLVVFLTGFTGGVYVGKSAGIPFVGHKTEWAIGMYTGESPLQLKPMQGSTNPILTAQDVTDVHAEFVADPFMFKENGEWNLFFEVLNAETQQGDLGLATSPDGLAWTYQHIVIDEPFHLSYPHVFAWQGDYYMVPESLEANEVRLYKAVDFPHRWEFVAPLLSGGTYIDPTVFRHEDKWWMFVETNLMAFDTLRLYYADSLTGTWLEHPDSPIVQGDANIARPGGRVIAVGDKLIRYAQDDEPSYGNQVWAFVIEEITPTSYRERAVSLPIIGSSGEGWNQEGMHHIDAHQIGPNQWIAAVDGVREQLILQAESLF